MKSIKITCIAVLTSLLSITLPAQVYVNVGAGFGFPAFQELIAVDYTATQSSSTYKGVYSSLGAGIQPEITIGYRTNPNTGIELGYGYLVGSKVKSEWNDASTSGFTDVGSSELKARMQRLYLGIRFTRGDENVHPFMRVGVVFGLGGMVTDDMTGTVTGPGGTSTVHRVEEYDGGLAVGLGSGLGVTYHISDMFGVYLEANMTVQNWSPKHSVITTYTIDGQDQLGGMTVRQKETNYVDEYTDSGSPNDGAPAESLKSPFPLSSWGFSVGFHFWFPGE